MRKALCLLCLCVAIPLLSQASKVWTPEDLFRRNVGAPEQQTKPFTPHKIIGGAGVNPAMVLINNKQVPQIAEEYMRSLKLLRSLPADVPLGSHPAMFNLAEKYPKVGKGPNPYIDPTGYKAELDIVEGVFNRILAEQKKAAGQN